MTAVQPIEVPITFTIAHGDIMHVHTVGDVNCPSCVTPPMPHGDDAHFFPVPGCLAHTGGDVAVGDLCRNGK